jgi:hypothetical protein
MPDEARATRPDVFEDLVDLRGLLGRESLHLQVQSFDSERSA